MPDKVVQVDGVGNVSFPDSMSDDDIAGVIKAQHPDQSPLDAGEVLKQYWGKVDPVSGAQQLAHAVENPVEAVKSYGDQNADLWNKAKAAFQNGKYGEGVRHTLSYLLNGIPGVGAALDEAGNKAGSGDVNGAIADTAALATQILAGKIAPAATDALTEPGAVSGAASTVANAGKAAGSAVLDAAKAGGTDIAAGAAKTGAGLATLKTHSMAAELGLGAPLVRSGTNQMIQGGKAALAAGKATFAEKMASALEDAKTAESPVDTSAVKIIGPERQLEAPALVTPAPADSSGIIKGWEPHIAKPNYAPAVPMPKPPANDFSWPGEMHGPESTEGSPTLPTHESGIHFLPEQFKTIAQAKKALNVSAVLDKNGVSADELAALPPEQLKGHLSELVKALGINKTGVVSDTSVNQILFQLRRLQSSAPE